MNQVQISDAVYIRYTRACGTERSDDREAHFHKSFSHNIDNSAFSTCYLNSIVTKTYIEEVCFLSMYTEFKF